MHKGHHGDADDLGFVLVAELTPVVCMYRGGDGAVFFARTDGGRFGVFEDFHVC